jgi:hypothetical protein
MESRQNMVHLNATSVRLAESNHGAVDSEKIGKKRKKNNHGPIVGNYEKTNHFASLTRASEGKRFSR